MKGNTVFFRSFFESKFLIIIFFLIMLAIRLLYLDADPSFVKRVSDLGDEGVWVHNPRTLFVLNNLTPDQETQSLSASPLNALLMIWSFFLLGVGTFQARLVSALAGWFTLIILYFFIRKAWGEKLAFTGVLILGLNDTFLIYNKWAFGISLEAMFLLLSFFCWYRGKENKRFYFFAGFSFALAILSKLSAYYLAPIFLLLWILQMYREEMSFQSIFVFAVGGVLPLIPYFYYLHAHWDVLSPSFLFLAKNFTSSGVLISNTFRVFSNNLFGLPGMFLLIFLTAIYFLKGKRLEKFKSMDLIELIALCWLLIGMVLLVLLSDISDRRFYGLLIPMSILCTKLFWEESPVVLDKIIQQAQKSCSGWSGKNALYALFFSFPIASFLISSLNLYFCRPIRACRSMQTNELLLFLLLFAIFLIILTLIRGSWRIYFIHFFTLSSIAVVLLMPLTTLLRHFSRHLAIITSTIDRQILYIIVSSVVAIIFLLAYIFLSFFYKSVLVFKPALIKRFFLLYFIISGTLIGITFISPSFSLRDASHSLNPILKKAEASGMMASLLAYEASYLPIWTEHSSINTNYDKNNREYFFQAELFDGQPTPDSGKNILQYYETAELVKKLYLFPYPFTKKYKVIIAVYKLAGYKGQHCTDQTAHLLTAPGSFLLLNDSSQDLAGSRCNLTTLRLIS